MAKIAKSLRRFLLFYISKIYFYYFYLRSAFADVTGNVKNNIKVILRLENLKLLMVALLKTLKIVLLSLT